MDTSGPAFAVGTVVMVTLMLTVLLHPVAVIVSLTLSVPELLVHVTEQLLLVLPEFIVPPMIVHK